MQKSETKTAKRILACIMVVVMALTAVPLGSLIGLDLSGIDLLTGKAKAYQEGNYTYKLEKGEAIITGYNDIVYEDIVIPSSFDGYKVTGIDDDAFSECSRITGIVIPDSVKFIGEYAFWECTRLKTVKMGNNVQEIGQAAFFCCEALESINLSSQITEIYWATFEDCYKLKDITRIKSIAN